MNNQDDTALDEGGQEHTLGLLRRVDQFGIEALGGRYIANAGFGPDWEDDEIAESNAARIVATWNACDGIPTKALTPGLVAQMLEALQGLLSLHQSHRRETTDEEIAAEYVIAKATGGAE